MGSQFVDFNADGHIDVFTATFDGSPHVAYGSAEGFAEPVRLHDKNGRRVMLTQFWDYGEKKWRNASGGEGHCCSAVAFDYDNDGDFDVLMGDKSKWGKLYVQLNEGTPGKPSFSGVNTQVMADGRPFALPGGVTAPRLADWNGDGLTDLVIGSFGDPYNATSPGGVYLYLNAGKAGAPRFSAPQALIPPTQTKGHERDRPNVGLYADPVDYDGDGDLDLVVGGYSLWTPAKRKLNSVEREQLTEVKAELESLNSTESNARNAAAKKAEALDSKARSAHMKKFRSSEQMASIQRKRRELLDQRTALEPMSQRKAGIWVYLRQS